jgi:hypothetical protein
MHSRTYKHTQTHINSRKHTSASLAAPPRSLGGDRGHILIDLIFIYHCIHKVCIIYSVCMYDSIRECLYDIICMYECLYEFVHIYTRGRARSLFVPFCAHTRLFFSPFPSLFLSLPLFLSPTEKRLTSAPPPQKKQQQEQWVTLTG